MEELEDDIGRLEFGMLRDGLGESGEDLLRGLTGEVGLGGCSTVSVTTGRVQRVQSCVQSGIARGFGLVDDRA